MHIGNLLDVKHVLHPPLVLNYYGITTEYCYCFLQMEQRIFCSNPQLNPIKKPEG